MVWGPGLGERPGPVGVRRGVHGAGSPARVSKAFRGEPLSPGRPGNVLLDRARPGWRARVGLVPFVLGFGLLLQKRRCSARRGSTKTGRRTLMGWGDSMVEFRPTVELRPAIGRIRHRSRKYRSGVRNVASQRQRPSVLAVGDGASGSPGTWWRQTAPRCPGVQFALSGAAGSPSVSGTPQGIGVSDRGCRFRQGPPGVRRTRPLIPLPAGR